jgi:hypothetical protein
MAVYGLAIFLSAFLLFQVQLFLAKYILPWFGGVPSVWTTCMLFFQLLLLGGYAYAHWLSNRLRSRAQRRLHSTLLAGCVFLFAALFFNWGSPLLPDASWKPQSGAVPVWQIVRLLTVSVGLPFFVLAATGPLVQRWFSIDYPNISPYRLYALSNVGSLLGLVSYPLLIEAWLPIKLQALLWTAGFLLFTASMFGCMARMRETGGVTAARETGSGSRPPLRRYLLWFALAACASMLLLATTNQMSQEVAVVPFLWMLPLCLYLLSFILCFDSERWYARGVFSALFALGAVLSVLVYLRGVDAHILIQIGVPAVTLFIACMLCHGEIARMKPAPRYLTSFYLTITAGGAAGGLVVGLAAPLMFRGMWEYPIALWATTALVLWTFWRDRDSPLHSPVKWPVYATLLAAGVVTAYSLRGWLMPRPPTIADAWLFATPVAMTALAFLAYAGWRGPRRPVRAASRLKKITAWSGAATALILFGVSFFFLSRQALVDTVYQSRNFYGVLHVFEDSIGDPEHHRFRLNHGRIVHGKQYQSVAKRREPSSYYGRDSGVGLAIHHHPRRFHGLRIGVVGLGIGTLAAYGMTGDVLRFYEINPDVITLAGPASETFSYVRDSNARIDFVLGDARVELERELARGAPQHLDILALDAFSSDSIPVHLLTREALDVYLRHLTPNGILAIHISNRSLELAPVVRALAQQAGLAHAFITAPDGDTTWSNTWALLVRNPQLLTIRAIADAVDKDENDDAESILWTDDYSNLLRVLKL